MYEDCNLHECVKVLLFPLYTLLFWQKIRTEVLPELVKTLEILKFCQKISISEIVCRK